MTYEDDAKKDKCPRCLGTKYEFDPINNNYISCRFCGGFKQTKHPKKVCPKCEGTGETWYAEMKPEGLHFIGCPRCNGTGEVNAK